jgi:hypothetical protein
MAGEVKPPEVRAISPPLGGEAIACKKKLPLTRAFWATLRNSRLSLRDQSAEYYQADYLHC